jgi:putative transposase
MSDYRRYFVPGGMYFFTLVTYGRQQILTTKEGRSFLRNAVKTIQADRPFQIFATVLLPDHWHLIMRVVSVKMRTFVFRVSPAGRSAPNFVAA